MVGRDRQYVRVTTAHDLEIDVQRVDPAVDVCEESSEVVPLDDIAFEGHLRAHREQSGGVRGRLWSETLDRPSSVLRLRSVDPEQPHSLGVSTQHHLDGVAIDMRGDGGDGRIERRCRIDEVAEGAPGGPGPDEEQQSDDGASTPTVQWGPARSSGGGAHRGSEPLVGRATAVANEGNLRIDVTRQ